MKRMISFSEVATLLECQARHDFAYVGQLAGDALKRRETHIRLREGRAWGRAVAALHSWDPEDPSRSASPRPRGAARRPRRGHAAAARRRRLGSATHTEHVVHLEAVLRHYAETAEPLALTHPELELRLPIPSRAGTRASPKYEFQGYLDGLHRDEWGLWIVEYKLRQRLQGTAQIQLGRQYRMYGWAAGRALDEPIQGVIVDERLNEAPKPPRMLKSGLPSHARDQLTTPDAYIEACREAGVEHDQAVADVMAERKWQRRERVIFLPERDARRRARAAHRGAADLDVRPPPAVPDPPPLAPTLRRVRLPRHLRRAARPRTRRCALRASAGEGRARAGGGGMTPKMTAADAEEYTQALGQVVAGGWRQVALGQRLGVPDALGLTVREWVEGRLGGYVQLSIPERREAVAELSGNDMSARAIGAIVGASHTTVERDQAELNGTSVPPGSAKSQGNPVSGGTDVPRELNEPEPPEPPESPSRTRQSVEVRGFDHGVRNARVAAEQSADLVAVARNSAAAAQITTWLEEVDAGLKALRAIKSNLRKGL